MRLSTAGASTAAAEVMFRMVAAPSARWLEHHDLARAVRGGEQCVERGDEVVDRAPAAAAAVEALDQLGWGAVRGEDRSGADGVDAHVGREGLGGRQGQRLD